MPTLHFVKGRDAFQPEFQILEPIKIHACSCEDEAPPRHGDEEEGVAAARFVAVFVGAAGQAESDEANWEAGNEECQADEGQVAKTGVFKPIG